MLTIARDAHRDHHVDQLEAEDPALLLLGRAHDPVLGERRVEVDHVRHHGRADDPDREENALGALERRDESPCATRAGSGSARKTCEANATTMTPMSAAITASSRRKPRAWSARIANAATPVISAAGKSGIPKRRLQADRGADELGEVGRHRDHLRLEPEPDARPVREPLAAHLGQVHPGGDPELRAHRLDQHRHQVGHEDHPQEQVAELRAAGHVRREVARVDVRDRGDEGRPEERPQSARRPACPPASDSCAASKTRASPGRTSSSGWTGSERSCNHCGDPGLPSSAARGPVVGPSPPSLAWRRWSRGRVGLGTPKLYS